SELSISLLDDVEVKLQTVPQISAELTAARNVDADELNSTVLDTPSNVVPLAPVPRPPSHPPFPMQYSSSHVHSLAHAGSYSQARPRPRRSRMLFIVVPGIVVGVVIGIALALG